LGKELIALGKRLEPLLVQYIAVALLRYAATLDGEQYEWLDKNEKDKCLSSFVCENVAEFLEA